MQEGKRRRNAKVQECKSIGSKSEGTQECMKVREEGIQKFRDARVKKHKSAWNQEWRNSRMHECNRRWNARVQGRKVKELKSAGKQESRDARV
jgi:hypothetical protein